MSHADPEPCLSQSFTTSSGQSGVCQNPFCKSIIEPLPDGCRRTARHYCSKDCRMNVYALRRVRAMLNKVGIVQFHTLLDEA